MFRVLPRYSLGNGIKHKHGQYLKESINTLAVMIHPLRTRTFIQYQEYKYSWLSSRIKKYTSIQKISTEEYKYSWLSSFIRKISTEEYENFWLSSCIRQISTERV